MKMKSLFAAAAATALASCSLADGNLLPQGWWRNMLHLGTTLQTNIPTDNYNGGFVTDYFANAGLGSEANLNPYPGESVDLGSLGLFSWTELTIDGDTWEPGTDNYIAYFHIYLVVPGTETREVRYRFAHDDHLSAWNNGRQFYTQNYDGNEHTCDDYLSPGINSITFKLAEGGGGDYVRVSMTDRDGNFFSDISYNLISSDMLLANPVTGSSAYTCTNELSTVFFPDKPDCDMYQISLSGDESELDPDGWLAYDPDNAPSSIAFPAPAQEGSVTVYAWFKSTTGAVSFSSQSIVYSTVAPTLVAEDLTKDCVGASTRITLGEIDKGSIANAGRFVSLAISCAEDLAPSAEYVELAARDEPYTVTLTGVNEAGVSASTNVTVTLKVGYDMFNLDFESETGYAIATEDFSVSGSMTHPTAVRRNGDGRGSTIQPATGGFATQHAEAFGHNSDYGEIQITGPNSAPFIGTTSNPTSPGRLWTFSIDTGSGNPATDTIYDVVVNKVTYPVTVLRTAPDANGAIDNLILITTCENGYAVGHADGHVIAIPNISGNTAYRMVFELDVDSGTFRIKSGTPDGDLAYVPGIFPLMGNVAAKGIGGFYLHAAMSTYGFGETQYRYDNIRLSAATVPTSIDGFLVTDATTGDPATATGADLAIEGTAFGPGYTHYILYVGDDPQAPVDADDARWVEGSFPSAATIPSPVDGEVYTVALWLLEPDGSVTEFSRQIAFSASSAAASDLAVNVADGVPTATWSTASAVGGRAWYGTTSGATDGVTAYEAAPTTDHSAILEGLVPGKTYYVVPESAGVRSGSAVSFDYLVDAPVISNVAIESNFVGRISATWNTDGAAIGWIECVPVAGGETIRSEFGAYGANHSATVTGLDENTKYNVTIHADASSVSQIVRTRRVGAFTITFDDDAIMHAIWAGQGFGPVEVEPYNVAGGMTHPTYAYRRGTMNRTDTTVNQPSGFFDTQYGYVRIHGGEYGDLRLTPGDDVVEPFARTTKDSSYDPWTFSFDCAFNFHFFDDPNFKGGYAYFNLLSSRMNPGDALGAILSVQIAKESNDLVVLYADENGDEQSAMLVEDMAVASTSTTPIYHLKFKLDMSSQTFDAYVDGECVATGLGFHSAPEGSGVAGFQVSGGGVYGEHAWLLDNISLVGGLTQPGTVIIVR